MIFAVSAPASNLSVRTGTEILKPPAGLRPRFRDLNSVPRFAKIKNLSKQRLIETVSKTREDRH